MEREVRVSEIIATFLSLVGGILGFCGTLLLQVAGQIAIQNGINMAVVSSIGNGPVVIGLIGSYVIYKEKITLWHTSGSMLCLIGILILAFSIGQDDGKGAQGVEVVENESKARAMRLLLIDSFAAMLMFGVRIVMGKYLTRILSPITVIKLGFIADFSCGAFILILSAIGAISIPFGSFFAPELLGFAAIVGALNCTAELMLFKALNDGLTGPVSAIISFNAAFVSVLTWILQGIALTFLQVIGIIVAIAGVLAVSLSK